MLFTLGTLAMALSLHTAHAVPMTENRLEDIQCRCLTFRANDKLTTCNFFESKGFGWRSAQMLASQYDIKVQFASKSTISKVLSATQPLPSDMLQTTSSGDVQSTPNESNMSQNKIVCGFGKEVTKMTHRHHNSEPQSHFASQVLGWLLLFIAFYVVGEYIWTRYSKTGRAVKLKGKEKPLKARPSNNESSKHAPSDFS